MVRIGSLIEVRNGAFRVAPVGEGIMLGKGEFFARSLRTGQQVICKVNPVGFTGRPDLTRVALFMVTTETAVIDGRYSVVGRKGRLITGAARTLTANRY